MVFTTFIDSSVQLEVIVARALFVTGFNRSGTTLLTTAVTQATGAATLTAGYMARHLPKVDEFLTEAKTRETPPDRGVDRLPVTESTPEEYGWLLGAKTGNFSFGDQAIETGFLHTVIDEIAQETGADTVVLKNPWDTGKEDRLVNNFANGQVIIVRRRLSAIEDSLTRAWDRMANNNEWVQALMGDPDFAAHIVGVLSDPEARAKMVADSKAQTRERVRALSQSIFDLPLDRVAFVTYEELRGEPREGAAWAAHILNPDALAGAITAKSFPEFNQSEQADEELREIDVLWADSWDRVRQEQVKAGIIKG
jgi:hypothetical protein